MGNTPRITTSQIEACTRIALTVTPVPIDPCILPIKHIESVVDIDNILRIAVAIQIEGRPTIATFSAIADRDKHPI